MSDIPHVVIRTEVDDATPSAWWFDSEAAARLFVMNHTLEDTLKQIKDDFDNGEVLAVELVDAYKEDDFDAYMEAFKEAWNHDVHYTVMPVESYEAEQTRRTEQEVEELLDEHFPVEEGKSPGRFMCACGETVLRGDSFYSDEDGDHCMDCGMDIQDGLRDEEEDEEDESEEDDE